MSRNLGLWRIQMIQSHLTSDFEYHTKNNSLDLYRQRGMKLNSQEVQNALFGKGSSLVYEMANLMEKSELFDQIEETHFTIDEHQGRVIQQILEIYPRYQMSLEKNKSDPGYIFNLYRAFSLHSTSLTVRLLVNISIYCDAINLFGTEKHEYLAERGYKLQDYGCIATTELGHGSNFNEIETVATYEHETRSFVFRSMSKTATKMWIGALGRTANQTVVSALLVIDGKNHGVHMFVIPIRDRVTHDPLPGLVIGHMGAKVGLNGIDNGFMVFNGYRAPYDTLLDRQSQISPEGKFMSQIESDIKRYALTIESLNRSRITVLLDSTSNLIKAISIAIRYAAVRKQFGISTQQENVTLDYQLQRHKLIPHLVKGVGLGIWCQIMVNRYAEITPIIKANPDDVRTGEFYALLIITKCISGWYAFEGVNKCRESAGGMGYSSYAIFGQLRTNSDIHLTWEGDNDVLLQLTAKFILKQFSLKARGKTLETNLLEGMNVDRDAVMANSATFTRGNISKNDLLDGIFQRINVSFHNAIEMQQEYQDPVIGFNNSIAFGSKDLSIGFIEHILVQEYYNQADSMTDENTRVLYQHMAKLYACECLERGAGDLYGYLTRDQLIYLREEILSLCDFIAESSVNLIDCFAIPDSLIGSAIGQSNGQAYENFTNAVEKYQDRAKPQWMDKYLEVRNSKPTHQTS